MRDVGVARGNDAPDDALLVLVEADDIAGAGQRQVAAVEVPRHQIVEPVVVDARQPVSAVRVGPHPVGEGLFDPRELLFGGLGRLDVEHAALGTVLDDGVVDLRRRTIQRVVQKQSGMAARGAPFGDAGGRSDETGTLDAPRRDLDGVPDPHLRSHDLGREALDDIRWQPRSTEAGRDVGRADVPGLDFAQRGEVALVLRVERGRCFGGGELCAHRAGQVGVRRLPGLCQGIAENRGAELRQGGVRIAFEKLAQVFGIDAAGLIESDRKRIGCRGYYRRRRRRDDAVGKDRAHAGEPALEVVVLDAGHQPAIGVVGEGCQVRAPMDLAFFAGLRIERDGDDSVVDRSEVAEERGVGDAQPHLGLRPRAV